MFCHRIGQTEGTNGASHCGLSNHSGDCPSSCSCGVSNCPGNCASSCASGCSSHRASYSSSYSSGIPCHRPSSRGGNRARHKSLSETKLMTESCRTRCTRVYWGMIILWPYFWPYHNWKASRVPGYTVDAFHSPFPRNIASPPAVRIGLLWSFELLELLWCGALADALDFLWHPLVVDQSQIWESISSVHQTMNSTISYWILNHTILHRMYHFNTILLASCWPC